MATRDAAHKLVTSHLRLVAKIAMGYRGYGLPIGEVVSEGNVGLMQAVKRFEPDKGFRLATYAMWWIKAAIQEYILRSWSLVKMGTTANQKKLFFNLRKAKGQISALDEGDLRPDQVKQIATRLGVTEQDVVDMNRRLGGDASLNAPLREEGEGEWQDWLVDDSASQETRARRRAGGPEPPRGAARRARRAQPARAPHLRGAPPRRGPDHAGGAVDRVRRLARARAPDRGAGLREGAGGGREEPRRPRGAARRRGRGLARRLQAVTLLRRHWRKASLTSCSPETPFSKDRMARCPEAKRIGRSIQLRRMIRSVLRSTSPGEVRQPDQEEVFLHRHRQAGSGVPRTVSSFLNCSRPTSRTARPGSPGGVVKASSIVCEAGSV